MLVLEGRQLRPAARAPVSRVLASPALRERDQRRWAASLNHLLHPRHARLASVRIQLRQDTMFTVLKSPPNAPPISAIKRTLDDALPLPWRRHILHDHLAGLCRCFTSRVKL